MSDEKAVCSKCENEKSIEEFPRRSDGRYIYCSECQSKYHKEWYDNNKEMALAQQAAHRSKEDVKARRKEYAKAYYQKNRQRLNAAAKEYYKHNRSRKLKTQKRWQESNKRRVKDWQLKKKYGVSIEEYDALRKKQGGGCAICGRTEDNAGSRTKMLSVDHCHDSGEIRGLLCQFCNRGLGLLGDDVESLERALDYLKRKTR